jgi:hypothetical protein
VATRDRILAAARAGDLDALAALADPAQFTYSYGDGGDPAGYWRSRIDAGEDVLGVLIGILELPPSQTAVEGGPDVTIWPFAFDRPYASLSSAELVALEEVIGSRDLATYRDLGTYLAHRVGIRADGAWIFFVAGD